ncbi:hypothetical protein ACMUMQ_10715 [Marinomonas sp. 2405UD66-6]|uniref:hypothetical protein n=1 Tax=Marinomonas sp. 2405UD66-6 TaxID=3391834 RepID=UPI0039C99528
MKKLLRVLIRLPRACVAAFYWSKSVSKAASGDYKKSLILLERSEKFRYVKDECFFLLKGFLFGTLGSRDSSIESFEQAIFYAFSNKSRLNIDEKKYIINYSSMIVSNLNYYGYPFSVMEFNLERVAPHLIDKFPYNINRVNSLEKFSRDNAEKILVKIKKEEIN